MVFNGTITSHLVFNGTITSSYGFQWENHQFIWFLIGKPPVHMVFHGKITSSYGLGMIYWDFIVRFNSGILSGFCAFW